MPIVLFILVALVLIALFLNHEHRREKQAAEKSAAHWRGQYAIAEQGWDKSSQQLRDTKRKLAAEQEKNVRYLERLGETQAQLDAATSQLADANLRLEGVNLHIEGATACLTGPLADPDDDDMPF